MKNAFMSGRVCHEGSVQTGHLEAPHKKAACMETQSPCMVTRCPHAGWPREGHKRPSRMKRVSVRGRVGNSNGKLTIEVNDQMR